MVSSESDSDRGCQIVERSSDLDSDMGLLMKEVSKNE